MLEFYDLPRRNTVKRSNNLRLVQGSRLPLISRLLQHPYRYYSTQIELSSLSPGTYNESIVQIPESGTDSRLLEYFLLVIFIDNSNLLSQLTRCHERPHVESLSIRTLDPRQPPICQRIDRPTRTQQAWRPCNANRPRLTLPAPYKRHAEVREGMQEYCKYSTPNSATQLRYTLFGKMSPQLASKRMKRRMHVQMPKIVDRPLLCTLSINMRARCALVAIASLTPRLRSPVEPKDHQVHRTPLRAGALSCRARRTRPRRPRRVRPVLDRASRPLCR